MSHLEQIQHELNLLPPDKQGVVLDFIASLRMGLSQEASSAARRTLREHPAFGSWRNQGIDALGHEQTLRAEWDA